MSLVEVTTTIACGRMKLQRATTLLVRLEARQAAVPWNSNTRVTVLIKAMAPYVMIDPWLCWEMGQVWI